MNAGDGGITTLDRVVLITVSVLFLCSYRLWRWSRADV